MDILPADYPPPFRPSDQVVLPSAAEDERIEVGVLIVGAGPAGLATAARLGQLLGEDPELTEQLGEVPIAVADKGKTAGSHLLSGAVMRPGPLKALFPDTPDDAFLVACDRSTNPQENVDAGIVTARVAFAPLKPAEFVVIEISQKSLLA